MVDFKKKLKINKLEGKIIDFIKGYDAERSADWGVSFQEIETATKAKKKVLKETLNQLYKQKKIRVKYTAFGAKLIFYNYDIEDNE